MIATNKIILFFNEASARIGIGHLMRSQNLAKEMQSRGYTIVGVTVGEQKAVRAAEKCALQSEFNWLMKIVSSCSQAKRLIREVTPSLVVIDSTNLAKEIIFFCYNNEIKSVALDYFDVSNSLPNTVINLIDHNPLAIRGGVPNRLGIQYFEGPKYAIVRDEFLKARKSRLNSVESIDLHRIVIAFGGADPAGNSRKTIKFLQDFSNKLCIDLIVGPLFVSELRESLEIENSKHEVTFHEGTCAMGALFEKADLLFCGGGGTVLESLCVGVPTVVFAQNEPEQRHASFLASKGACWLYENIDWSSIKSQTNRVSISQIAKATVDGGGTKRICDIVEVQLELV